MRYLAERVYFEFLELPAQMLGMASVDLGEVPERTIDIVEKVLYLRKTSGFATANVNALAVMARQLEEVRLPAGTQIWKAGDPGDRGLTLLKGTVRCVVPDGREFTYGPGTGMGGIDALADRPRWFSATAETAPSSVSPVTSRTSSISSNGTTAWGWTSSRCSLARKPVCSSARRALRRLSSRRGLPSGVTLASRRRMASRSMDDVELEKEFLADERVRSIEWSHPALAPLSDPARLIYASLVDGCSEEAKETIAGVDIVWRNREGYRKSASNERKSILQTICSAVDELLTQGLLLLLDERTISGGWVRKPWEGLPS